MTRLTGVTRAASFVIETEACLVTRASPNNAPAAPKAKLAATQMNSGVRRR
jgi:hypothetical protein